MKQTTRTMAVNTAPTLGLLFTTIVEFRYELMSMLCPSDLYTLLPMLGYRLSETERNRYMTIDRQVLKSTAFIDRMIKEGYSVVLLGNNLREIYEVMRGKKVGDISWNTRTWAGLERVFGWHQKRTCDESTQPGKQALFPSASGILEDIALHDFKAKRASLGPWYKIRVMIYITHPRDLEFDGQGRTVTRNPNIPVPLPGTWEAAPYWMAPGVDGNERPYELRSSTADGSYQVNKISGAKLRLQPAGFKQKTSMQWDAHGFWNARTDLTEDCAKICFFQESNLIRDTMPEKGAELRTYDTTSMYNSPQLVDGTIVDADRENSRAVHWEYVHLHREPRVLVTVDERGDDPFNTRFMVRTDSNSRILDDTGNPQHYLVLEYALHGILVNSAAIPL